jgi:ZIP family zinc transporter
MIDPNAVLIAFGLTLLAGLSTGLGASIAFFFRRTNIRMLSLALGFSAGVMLYVSFLDILPQASGMLAEELGQAAAYYMPVAFFAGIATIVIIDRLVPEYENPHEFRNIRPVHKLDRNLCQKLMRTGYLVAIAIAIHNFPEGIATFAGALVDLKVGIAIALAIALHNIPEGIAVSMPIYCATGKKRKAFFWSFASGLAEPLGALLGYFLLIQFFGPVMLGMLFAFVAGIMVFISLDELLPAAREFGNHHLSIYGLILGMAVMALSMILI